MQIDLEVKRVPAGLYRMKFDGFGEPFEQTNYAGDGVDTKVVARFVVIEEGEWNGEELPVFCKIKPGRPHPKSTLAKVLKWITGSDLGEEGSINTDDFIGVEGTGSVGPNQNGKDVLLSFKADEVEEF